MPAFAELRVVTTAAWLARDLAASGVLPVVHDIGLDVPADTSSSAWWAPHRFVTRLHATERVTHPALRSPGPAWLATVHPRWLHRQVWAGSLSSVRCAPLWDTARRQGASVFGKAAEVKLNALPARPYTDPETFLDAASAAGLHPSSGVVLSELVEFVEEHRCFIAPGADGVPEVSAASAYLVGGVTWDFWERAADAPDPSGAVTFAARVAASTPGPEGYVLDVGRLADGSWSVVEANASWSSNPYHCDPAGVVNSVLAAQDPAGDRTWAWRSDPCMGRFARPLPVRST